MANGASGPSVVQGSLFDLDAEDAADLKRMPAEDAGAPTQGNFHYQTEIIASFCLAMPTDVSVSAIICEWDEDFIIVRDRVPRLELISVKHHDRKVYTTMKSLCDDGGLLHLFDRWLGYATEPAARLCSNTQLGGKPSEPTPRALLDACIGNRLGTPAGAALVTHLAWAMMDMARSTDELVHIPKPAGPFPAKAQRDNPSGLPAGLVQQLQRFVQHLQFDCDRPAKDHIRDVNIRQLAEPAMVKLGYAPAMATHAYRAVVDLVGEASRDQSGRPPDLARYLTEPGAYAPGSDVAQAIERRSLPRASVLTAVRVGIHGPSQALVPLIRPGEAAPRAAGGHQLAAKMSLGLIDDAEQENALRLRDLWLHTWPQVKTGFPEDIEAELRLELEILEVVRRVRQHMVGQPDPYGIQFQALLHEELRSARLSAKVSLPLDDFHVIGFAYELSDICRFGFVRPTSGS